MAQLISQQQAPIKQAQTAYDAQSGQQQKNITALTQALGSILQGIAPGVQQTYADASSRQAAFAKGFSDQIQAAQQARANNTSAFLQNVVGAPESQVAQVNAQVNPAGAGDALYAIRGYIPASTLNEEGAAYTANAQQLPAIANAQGLQQIGKVQQAQRAQDAKFAQQLGQVGANAPTLTRQLTNDAFNQAYKTNAQKLAVAKYNTGIDEFNARQKLSAERMNQQAQQFAVRQSNADRNYTLSLKRLGISEKNLQLRIAANAFKQAHGGYSATQMSRFNTKLDALQAHGLTAPVNGVMPTPQYFDPGSKKWVDITPTTAVPKNALTRNTNTYANFVRASLKAGVPLQLVLARANSIYPETQRGDLGGLTDLPAVAAQAAKQAADYNQMTGVTLGTSPNGTPITWSAPKSLSAAGMKAVGGILNLASEYLGTPYAWGGESPTGFDCSGLAQYLYAKEGIRIPRTTYDQFQGGLSVPKGQLQAGDLVFFRGSDSKVVNAQLLPGHVGIYIGGGKFVEAPKTGDVVKVSSLAGRSDYMGARRYVH